MILVDVKQGPLDIAKGNLNQYNVEPSNYDLRLGNGLEPVRENEVDAIVIAGMGGVLIADIMGKDIKKTHSFKRFILQPRNASEYLRKWLVENGFKIINEKLAKENRFICEIIVAEKGEHENYTELEFELGKRLFENGDPLLEAFLNRLIAIESKIYETTRARQTLKSVEQNRKSTERLRILKEALANVNR